VPVPEGGRTDTHTAQDNAGGAPPMDTSIKNVPWCLLVASTYKVEGGIAFADFLTEWTLETDFESKESKIDGFSEPSRSAPSSEPSAVSPAMGFCTLEDFLPLCLLFSFLLYLF